MPRIPYTTTVDARTNRANTPLISANASPDAFGAQSAKALGGVADDLADASKITGQIAVKEKVRQQKEQLANIDAQSNYTERALELRNKVGADGAGYVDEVKIDYNNWVQEQADKIDDDVVRSEFKQKKAQELDGIITQAAQYEFTLKAEASKLAGDTSVNAVYNKIAQEPQNYDTFLEQGKAVIDALPNMTEAAKAGMKQTFQYDAAKRRFQGMINTAKNIDDFNNIANDMAGKTGRDWSKEMLATDYQSLLNEIGTNVKTFQTRYDTDARATLTALEERTKQGTFLIPQNELQAAQETVKNTTDPNIQQRMARVMRDQELIRNTQRLPPAEIRAQINAANGNPDVAYPGMPPEMSTAINKASNTFGVSASYLGATVSHEYGENLKKKPKKLPKEFAPTIVNNSIDARNIRSEVMDAVTTAGMQLGAPLAITKGKTSSTSVSVSTVGMDGASKAKIVGALVDSGFTGVEEYDNYINVSFTGSVPTTYGEKDGKAWGGWTYLSPEIAETLKQKGFKAGADSKTLTRNALSQDEAIDYGKPTSILDENGKPTSTAVGAFQFIDSTWLRMLKKPNVSAAMGVDVSKMTDAQILELRKNPELSTMAAAAYALENKSTLEETFGRPISDAELYMAHFMGADGATAFLTQMKNNPSAIAADLMPAQAKANKGVFYAKGGVPKTVAEIYGDISRSFNFAPSRVGYEDNQTRERVLKQAEAQLANDPIAHASTVGSHTIIPLSEDGGIEARGTSARAIADYYSIPASTMKPFTVDETDMLKKQLDEGTADDNISLIASIQRMGPDMSKAALIQLGEKDRTFAHAADLYIEGQPGVAGDIIRGRKRLNENPDIAKQMGTDEGTINDTFAKATGGAFNMIEPSRRQAIQDAAYAYYVQKQLDRGSMGSFDKTEFENAIQAVSGGSANSPAVDVVNGAETLLPKGITADVMETAIDRMRIEDYTAMSKNGLPPMYVDKIVDPYDIRNEVTMQSIGGGMYRMKLADDTFLTTGKINAQGRAEAYIFKPDPKKIAEIASRPDASVVSFMTLNQGMIK